MTEERRVSLLERTAALNTREREAIARRWLIKAGQPVTNSAINALTPQVLPFRPGSPLDRLAIERVREHQPIVAEELLAEQATRGRAFQDAAWARARDLLLVIVRHRNASGRGPSWLWAGRQANLSPEHVRYLIRQLTARGLLTHTRIPGSLDVTPEGRRLLAATTPGTVIDLREQQPTPSTSSIRGEQPAVAASPGSRRQPGP